MNNWLIKIIALIFTCTIPFCYKFCYTQTTHATPPTFQINLDNKPEERWDDIIQKIPSIKILEFAQSLQPIIDHSKVKIAPFLPQLLESSIFPQEYKEELNGIIKSLEKKLGTLPPSLSYENLFLLNITYELFVCCTSGIIIGKEEVPYLFRNLDWPLLSSTLRACTINIEWYKNKSCLFKSTGFLFLVGVYTGQQDRQFAISINSRHLPNGSITENFAYYLKNKNIAWPASILTRQVLQYAHTYQEAHDLFKKNPLISPAYIIIAGTNANEGIILACNRNKIDLTDSIGSWLTHYPHTTTHVNPRDKNSPLTLNPKDAQTKYIVISNIDSDYSQEDKSLDCKTGCCKSPLQIEKKYGSTGPKYRRNLALNCCCSLTSNFTTKDLFKQILWMRPIQNKFTVYSSVMCPQKNIFQSYTDR